MFNQDDKFWSWIAKHKTDNTEGFVPANILKEVVTDKIKSRGTCHEIFWNFCIVLKVRKNNYWIVYVSEM